MCAFQGKEIMDKDEFYIVSVAFEGYIDYAKLTIKYADYNDNRDLLNSVRKVIYLMNIIENYLNGKLNPKIKNNLELEEV